MKDFAFLFRQTNYDPGNFSTEEIRTIEKKWQDWIGGIAAQGRLVSHGPRLRPEGKVLKPGGLITDGPFVEIRELLGGLLTVRAESLEEAVTLAHGCPVLEINGSVEIRPLLS